MKFSARPSIYIFSLIVLCMTPCAGCRKDVKAVSNDSSKRVFCSNYPLAYFAERISGLPQKVDFPEIEGDPVFWRPSPDNIAAMQDAAIVLINGATYEKWMNKTSLAAERILDTSASFRDQYIHVNNISTHNHGPAGVHSHSGTAFTTWIDFAQAVEQARAVKDALVAAQIGQAEELTRNFQRLKEQLLALDAAIEEIAKQLSDVEFFASHPVYDYFSRRYQLNVRSVLWEPDSFPDEAMWAALKKMQTERPADWMIWEDEPLPQSVKRLEDMGIRSIVFNPCGNRPDEGDFLSVMKSNAENMRSVLVK